MIEIRPLGAAAASAMAEVHRQAFDAPWTEAEITTLLEGLGAFALGAIAEEALAGFILCRIAADEAEVLTLATGADYRRRGVAMALLSAAGAAAGAAGALTLFLEVAEDNPAALGLYRAGGFAQVGLRPGYYVRANGAAAALIMRLDLNR